MTEDRTVEQLVKISKPTTFGRGQVICHEGQPGEEMYIVISGLVGTYISTLLDDRVKVAEVQPGDFFGEMALFDGRPRSATCIALEETICIAIGRRNLRALIVGCPDIAEKLMVNLSTRLREMNDKLYKVEVPDTEVAYVPFSLPVGLYAHSIGERQGDVRYLSPLTNKCPCCGRQVLVQEVRQNELTCTEVLPSQRHLYRELDVLWHYIWSCPACGYCNYYMRFFTPSGAGHGELLRILTDENEYLKGRFQQAGAFDHLVVRYLRAIHFNECVNAGDTLLLGKLWLYLSWLFADAGDEAMRALCRGRALPLYRDTYQKNSALLRSEGARQQCAMIVAELCREAGDPADARAFYYEVVKYSGRTLRQTAYERMQELREV